MADTMMFVDIRERGKTVATCSLDITAPGKVIEVKGPKAEAFQEELDHGFTYHEGGQDLKLKRGRDDVMLMTSMFKILSGTYVRASAPYFNGEKPEQLPD